MIGVVLGGIALLGMVIGGLWIWTKFRRAKTQNGGTGCSNYELSTANTGLSSLLHGKRIHEIDGGIESIPELSAPGHYELRGDEHAHEMPTSY